MTKKTFAIGVILIMSLIIFCGCNYNQYSAVVVSSGLLFKKDFLRENMTYGARYYNENYNPDTDNWGDEYLKDTTSPEFRIFIIKDIDSLYGIFQEFPEVNFEKEIVLV